jgi:glucokinase
VAAVIGAEAGIGVGLLVAGGTVLAPLAFGAAGAGIAAAAVQTRNLLVRRWLRAQLRAAR